MIVFIVRAFVAMIRALTHSLRYLSNITMLKEIKKMIAWFWIGVFYQTFLFSLVVGVEDGVKHVLLHGSLFDGGMKAYFHPQFHYHIPQVYALHESILRCIQFNEFHVLQELNGISVAVKSIEF